MKTNLMTGSQMEWKFCYFFSSQFQWICLLTNEDFALPKPCGVDLKMVAYLLVFFHFCLLFEKKKIPLALY